MRTRHDQADFERELAAQVGAIRRIGRRMLRRAEDDIDDFTQDVLLRAWANRAQLSEMGRLSQWVAAIARNAARNARRTAPHVPTGDAHGLLDERPTVSDELETTERWGRLFARLNALDPTHRELLVARYVDGASYEELQERHGLSYAALASRIHRAKRQARRLVQASLGAILGISVARPERAFAQGPRPVGGHTALSAILLTSSVIVGAVAVGGQARRSHIPEAATQTVAAVGASLHTMDRGPVMGDLTVRREDGRVWIEGVPGGQFGVGWDRFLRAMQALLKARGMDADMATLMAMSGDAFNLCHASHWQGVADLCTPTDPLRVLTAAYGFDYDATHQGYPGAVLQQPKAEIRDLTEQALSRLREEIDAGRPVLIAGAEDHCGSCSVVVGYSEKDGTLCHVGDGEPYRWTPIRGVTPGAVDYGFELVDGRSRGTMAPGANGGWYANPIYLVGARTAMPSARERALSALRGAVALHDSPAHERPFWGGVQYYFGARAYEEWEKALRELQYPEDLERDLAGEVTGFGAPDRWYTMENMAIQVDQVVRGRSAAAGLLEASAELLPEASEFVQGAARHYREEVSIARRELGVFVAQGADNEGKRTAWLSDEASREAGAGAIAEMAAAERAAIAQIVAALAAVDGEEAP